MALGVYFQPEGFTAAKYDDCILKLNAAGAGAPAGRVYHVAFGEPEKLQIFDIWESEAAFEAFGATLLPILGEMGVDPGKPMFEPIHSTIVGK